MTKNIYHSFNGKTLAMMPQGNLQLCMRKNRTIGSTYDCFDSLYEQLESFALHQFNAWHQLQLSTL